jgi:hypothetical protein
MRWWTPTTSNSTNSNSTTSNSITSHHLIHHLKNPDRTVPILLLASTRSETSSEAAGAHPKRRKKSSEDNHWMETAANALTYLSNQADDELDEWDIFGKDVANSLRALNNPDWQRRAKFAIQTAIIPVTEKARHPFLSPKCP